jgi:hypothetical protein
MKFGSARYTMFTEYPIIGLAVPTDVPPDTNLFYTAWKEGHLKAPMYSLHYRRCGDGKSKDCENAGMLVLGGEDTANCEPVKALYQAKCNNSK